jgi:hypothetical protein
VTTHVLITEMMIGGLPIEHPDFSTWAVRVTWRGGHNYAVAHLGWVLNRDGAWEYEPIPSSREDDFIERTRFDYDTAYRLAHEQAPNVVVNGMNAAEVLARFPVEEQT